MMNNTDTRKKMNIIGLAVECALALLALLCLILSAIHGYVTLIILSAVIFLAVLYVAGSFLVKLLGVECKYFTPVTVVWNWLKNAKPSKRKLIQLYSALLFNANLKGFVNGKIYRGASKNLCTPGLNCYSCPGATGACPLGSLQNSLGSTQKRAPYYIVGIIILYGILLGRVICGLLCPFGLIQELLYKIKTPKLKKNRFTKILSYFKYVVLVFFVGIVPIMYGLRNIVLPGFCKYICPAGTIEGGFGLLAHKVNESEFARLGPLFTWKFMIAVSIIVGSVFIFRMFCRFICPLGALYGFFNKISVLGIKLEKPKCIDCGLCISKCKMDISEVGDHECINCGECVSVCPTQAISWRGGKIILPPDEIAPVTPEMSEEEKTECIEKTQKSNQKLAKRRLITKIAAIAVMVIVLVSALIYYNLPEKEEAVEEIVLYKVGDMCPSLEIPVYDGVSGYTQTFNPAENNGKVTVINFWGVWCDGCKKELPAFDRVASEYKDTVTVIAIHTFDQLDDSYAYIEGNYPDSDMLFGADRLPVGADSSASEYLYTIFGGSGTYPITIILNEDGKIFTLQTSELTYEALVFLISGAFASND